MSEIASVIQQVSNACKNHKNILIITANPGVIKDEVKRKDNLDVEYIAESCINTPVQLENVWRFFQRGDMLAH